MSFVVGESLENSIRLYIYLTVIKVSHKLFKLTYLLTTPYLDHANDAGERAVAGVYPVLTVSRVHDAVARVGQPMK